MTDSYAMVMVAAKQLLFRHSHWLAPVLWFCWQTTRMWTRSRWDTQGRMGEVYNWIEMIESAVQLLADRGLVDPKNVGIIGFSRTSWKTDLAMRTDSNFRFAAALSADGGLYNYGTYWTHNIRAVGESFESQLGGPPYGASLSLWVKYSRL